jgi:hypothetical protein
MPVLLLLLQLLLALLAPWQQAITYWVISNADNRE